MKSFLKIISIAIMFSIVGINSSFAADTSDILRELDTANEHLVKFEQMGGNKATLLAAYSAALKNAIAHKSSLNQPIEHADTGRPDWSYAQSIDATLNSYDQGVVPTVLQPLYDAYTTVGASAPKPDDVNTFSKWLAQGINASVDQHGQPLILYLFLYWAGYPKAEEYADTLLNFGARNVDGKVLPILEHYVPADKRETIKSKLLANG